MVPSGMASRTAVSGGHDRDLERKLEAQRDLLDDRPAGPHRVAEVKRDEAPDEVEELHDVRPVEAEFVLAQRDRLGIDIARSARHAQHADVAGDQTHQNEHEDPGAEQRRDHQQEPLEDVLVHRSSGAVAASDPPRDAAGVRRTVRLQTLRRLILVDPYVGQVLVEVVARADLPALHIGAVRDDPVPPQRD